MSADCLEPQSRGARRRLVAKKLSAPAAEQSAQPRPRRRRSKFVSFFGPQRRGAKSKPAGSQCRLEEPGRRVIERAPCLHGGLGVSRSAKPQERVDVQRQEDRTTEQDLVDAVDGAFRSTSQLIGCIRPT